MIELKQNLVPTAKSSNLFKQLSDLCDSISPPTDCSGTPQYFSELDEEPSGPGPTESSCQQKYYVALTSELLDVNEVEKASREEQVYSWYDIDFCFETVKPLRLLLMCSHLVSVG